MKSALAAVGLLVVLCALVNSASVRQNIGSWLGSCWNSNAYGGEQGEQTYCGVTGPVGPNGAYGPQYPNPGQASIYAQQFNRNVVVNRYAPAAYPAYRTPVAYRPSFQYRPWFRQF